MKINKNIKYIIFTLSIIIIAIFSATTYSRYVLIRNFDVGYASYPFYFNAIVDNASIKYSESISIPIDIVAYEEDKTNAFATSYEITLEENDKFQLSNPISGTIPLNDSTNHTINVVIDTIEGATISGYEVITLNVKSTKPYTKEISIPIIIGKKGSLYDFMKTQANEQTDELIDFTNPTITPGVYMNFESKDEEFPVYYYRGAVNNSLIYANHCWQIVRTTETGGLKIVYDGEVKNGQCTDDHDRLGSEAFNKKPNDMASPSQVGYMYGDIENILTISPSRVNDMKGGPEAIKDITNIINTSILMGTEIIAGESAEWNGTTYEIKNYKSYSEQTPRMLFKNAIEDKGDNNRYTCLSTSTTCEKIYYLYRRKNTDYVYGLELTDGTDIESIIDGNTVQMGTVFGHNITYDETNKTYTLQDTITVTDLDELEDDIRGGANGNYSSDNPNAFHYTCLTKNDTCEEVYYIYYNNYGDFSDTTTSASGLFGIKMEDGRDVTKTLDDLLSGSSNTTSSYAKDYIDEWYEGVSKDFKEGDALINHQNELEDAVFCNDRTIAGYHGWDIDADNHAQDNKYLHFDAFKRLVGEGDIAPTRPRLSCDVKNDAFTVDNPEGNQQLTYPIALLDADEAVLAGAIYNKATETYLKANSKMFLMSPYYISDDHIRMFAVDTNGSLDDVYASSDYGIRPAIVLKDIFTISSGDGTPENPYLLEKNQ